MGCKRHEERQATETCLKTHPSVPEQEHTASQDKAPPKRCTISVEDALQVCTVIQFGQICPDTPWYITFE